MNYVSTYKQERIFTLRFTNLSFLLHIHKNYNRRHLLAQETGGNMCLALVIDKEHNRAMLLSWKLKREHCSGAIGALLDLCFLGYEIENRLRAV